VIATLFTFSAVTFGRCVFMKFAIKGGEDMEKEVVMCRLSPEERETVCIISRHNGVEVCEIETSIRKHFNKLVRAGWTLTKLQETKGGDFVAACFEAPAKALTFRTVKT
jgi:hypothetical protein